MYDHGGGSGKIHLNWVDCKGYEPTLLQCGQGPFECRSHSEDVGVTCQGTFLCSVETTITRTSSVKGALYCVLALLSASEAAF